MVSISQILPPVQDRVDNRRQTRNLENFLNFDFSEHKKLSLIQDKVHNHAIDILKEIDEQYLDWNTYSNIWFSDSYNMRNISKYISDALPLWEQSIQNDSQKLVLLEKQCALFEKLVTKHNSQEADPKEKPLSFVNPYKKSLLVVSNYPVQIGNSFKVDVTEEISYDRLTTADELAASVDKAKNQPVLVQVLGAASVENNEKVAIPFNVIPKELFKSVSQDPQALFDPTDGQLRDKYQIVQISYDDPDTNVLYHSLFKAGENQALSHVYEQGYVAGKIAGHNQAIQKIQQMLSGK